jgi:pimeloyl-ACP methyl ester carboxylesterase
VVGGDLLVQALGCVGEEITVLVHRAPLNRHAIPNGGNRALEPGAAIGDDEFGPPQAAPDEVIEHGAPGFGALTAHLPDRQQHFLAVRAHADDDEQRDGRGFAVEPHTHYGAIENESHDRLISQRASVPGVPVVLHLAPYPAHRVLADRPTKQSAKCTAHTARIGAGQIGSRNQRVGFRFIGEVEEGKKALPQLSASDVDVAAGGPHQEIQFCTASDGVRIAYATVGTGPPLVKAANWLNPLEYDWHSPIWSHLLQAVAARYRLVRYDAQGNGLSDWDVEDICFEAFVRDLESVVEANGLKRFPLFGISQGCAVSIAYTVRHPERVSQLILYGGYARRRRRRGYQAEVEQADALLTLMRQGWGQENPAFRQIFTSLFMPGATAEQARWFNDLQRMTTSPENAVHIRRTLDEIDVVRFLPDIRVPTLVLHCRNDAVQPFEEGRRMAAGISGSRLSPWRETTT